jgi:hypothetical protein
MLMEATGSPLFIVQQRQVSSLSQHLLIYGDLSLS